MSWQSIKNSPVFIGGHRKCGTTLLLSLFDNHPDLFVYPGETGFFYKFYPIFDSVKYTDKEKEDRVINSIIANTDKILKKWINHKSCGDFTFENARRMFIEKIASTPRQTKDYFATILLVAWSLMSANKSERMWIEKTTSIEIYANTLFNWYPNAKFIHLIRDPRDNYGAIKSGWEKEYKHYFDSKERLLQSVLDRGKLGMELADINRKKYGEERYYILKFEDMVSDPERIMRSLCSFLAIKYNPCLLEPTFRGEPWSGNNFEDKKFRGISKHNLDSWKKRINSHEAKVIEYYFWNLLNKYEYPTRYSIEETADAATEHYKWFNYTQTYSLKVERPEDSQTKRA